MQKTIYTKKMKTTKINKDRADDLCYLLKDQNSENIIVFNTRRRDNSGNSIKSNNFNNKIHIS